MTPQEARISVIDPISPAIERVNLILFKPFNLKKWFVIGFCAWLAYLGQGGGGGGGGGHGGGRGGRAPDVQEAFGQAKEFVLDNLQWIAPLFVVGVILGIILWLVFTWLSSRGKFMFLHCVAQNKAEIKVPWRKYRRQGNSLFLFRVVVGLISFVVFALIIGVIVFLGFFLFASRTQPHALGIITLILLSLLIIVPVAIAFALLLKFTNDFVVPIMYLRASTCTDAWRQFWTLLTSNKGRFTLYILFQIVIAIAIGAIVLAVVCITCCCAGCILAIPYIGTVLMLPVFVFKRSYSLLYFRQFGPGFDVFIPEVETA